MNQEKKKTVGAESLRLMQQKQENSDPIAQSRAMLEDYEKNFNQALERGNSQYHGTFYIVVITKKERLMENVIRNYFLIRESCPTPEYDQIVYKCDKNKKMIDLLWTLPNMQACEIYRDRALEVASDEKELLLNILSFYDGSLLKKCKELNGELKESTASSSFDPKDFKDHENLIIQS